MLIEPRQPFSFGRTLRFILGPPAGPGWRAFEPLLDYFEEDEYRRAVEVAGELVLYSVRERRASDHDPSHLEVSVLSDPSDAGTQELILSLVARQFSTDLDLGPFERLVQPDPVLAGLTAHFGGMRIPQSPSIFETLISAILEQQVNLTFAHKVKKALVDAWGRKVEYRGRRYNAFPDPAALAAATPARLRRLQISGPKARYIIGIARSVLDGRLILEELPQLEPAAAHERLLALDGVGPWTAHYVGLRALGHLDCLPAADVGLQNMVRLFYGMRRRPGPEAIARLARKWRGWRSYGTFYLWLTYWEEAAWREQLAAKLRQDRRLRHAAVATVLTANE